MLGGQSADVSAGKVEVVVLIGVVGFGGQLVSPRSHDPSDQVAQIKLVRRKVGRQGLEQGGMAWRVGRPEIVDRIDQAPAHEVKPDPVYLGAGELGLRSQPAGQSVERLILRGAFRLGWAGLRRAGRSGQGV